MEWQKSFRANYKAMVDDLNTNVLIPHCISDELLTMKEKEEVECQVTSYTKNEKLLTILYRKMCLNSSLFASFIAVLRKCHHSHHIVKGLQNYLNVQVCDYHSHEISMSEMRNIYFRNFMYILPKVKQLNIRSLLPALISVGILSIEEKEEIDFHSSLECKAERLLSQIYEKGFKSYSAFAAVLLKSIDKSEVYLGQLLTDYELWQLMISPQSSTTWSCHCKEKECCKSKPMIKCSHILYDEATSDSGVEIESPILGRRVMGNVTPVACSDADTEKSFPLVTKHQVFTTAESTSYTCHSPSPTYIKYSRYIQSCYTQSQYFETQEWPPILTNKYINLALIKKEKVSRGKADDYTKATLHGSIDQIAKKKEPIELKYLFSDPNDRCIVVHGGPGIGKSTFALELCRSWKEFKSLNQFNLVQLVQLCNSNFANANDLKGLLSSDSVTEKYVDTVVSEIINNSGEGLLLVLDGYDELPMEKLTQSLFVNLIKGHYLPKCKILITTRPSITEKLEKTCGSYISKSIEILGFLKQDIVDYAEDVFAEDSKELTHFLAYINSNEMIRSMMYIPLNTAVICELYKNTNAENKSVPMTMTKLYSDLTVSMVSRFMSKNLIIACDDIDGDDNIVKIIDSFPIEIQKYIKELCLFAFQKLCSNDLMFKSLPDTIKHMGFIRKTCTVKILPFGKAQHTYIFLHLTLQEFLTAVHIALLTEVDQLEALRQLNNTSQDIYSVVLRFVAGLTNGFSQLPLSEIFKLLGVSVGSAGMNSCNSVALNCLYEAENPDLCSKIFTGGNVNFSPMAITPFDYYALGYCIANTHCHWKLCCIGAEGIEMISAALNANSEIHGRIALIKLSYEGNKIYILEKLPAIILDSLTELNLSNCELDQNACDSLANIVPSLHNLQKLDIGDNPFKEGEATKLLSALSQLHNLHFLDLLHAKLNFDDLQMLKGIIKPQSTLTCLIIGDSSMSTDIVEELVSVVLVNSGLKTLSIMNINLALLASHLSMKLGENSTLLNLMLWDRSFCIEGVETVLFSLEGNKTLKSITLMPWYKEHIDIVVFSLTTQERIKWFFYPEKKKA